MNQSKFSLADVLAVLASLSFGFLCFLGANFLNIGNNKVWGMPHTTGCVVIALCISLLLFSTAYGAKLLKRTNRNFKTCLVLEIVVLLLFALFAVFFATKASPFPHYFTVWAQRSEINSKLQANIQQAENMFANYESYANTRENLYEQKLKSVATAKSINPGEYVDYGFDSTRGVSDSSQIDTKMFSVHADLFPTNYSDTIAQNGIKEIATGWLINAKNSTSGWKPIGIITVVNDVEKNSNEWLNTLTKLSQVHEKGERSLDFEYPLTFDDVIKYFITSKNPSGISTGIAVLAYVLMLLSWYVTKRDSRATGSFATAHYEVIL